MSKKRNKSTPYNDTIQGMLARDPEFAGLFLMEVLKDKSKGKKQRIVGAIWQICKAYKIKLRLYDPLEQFKQTAEDALKLANAATSGPWNQQKEDKYFTTSSIWSPKKRAWDEEDEEYNVICSFSRTSEYGRGSDSHIDGDADFIAASRDLVPTLAEQNLRLIKALESADAHIKLFFNHKSYVDIKTSIEAILKGQNE